MNPSKLTRRTFVGAAVPSALAGMTQSAADRVLIGVIGTGGRGQALMREVEKCRDLNVAVTAVCAGGCGATSPP